MTAQLRAIHAALVNGAAMARDRGEYPEQWVYRMTRATTFDDEDLRHIAARVWGQYEDAPHE